MLLNEMDCSIKLTFIISGRVFKIYELVRVFTSYFKYSGDEKQGIQVPMFAYNKEHT